MKRIFALLVALSLTIGNSSYLLSCSSSTPPEAGETPEGDDPAPDTPVITPGYQDYERESVNFSELEYIRPDVEEIAENLRAIANDITKGTLSFEEELEKIRSIEDDYVTVNSMRTLTEIYNMQDTSNSYWKTENEYMTTAYPLFTDALEDLFVACARSKNKERFENEYFFYSLDGYEDGGIYTEAAISLMQKEAELENKYSSLSMSNITITYQGRTDTAANILKSLSERYPESSRIYEIAAKECRAIYERKLEQVSEDIFVELIKTRRAIADELGCGTYTAYAYKSMGYDYSKEDMTEFLLEINDTVYPIFLRLYTLVFNGFFHSADFGVKDDGEIMNTLFELYGNECEVLSEAYSYMLQHGLYDIAPGSDTRFPGAFTTYIDMNNSPFLFISTSGDMNDYLTLSHEFGHFADEYINFGNSASVDLSEVSSQALELLTVDMLKDVLDTKEHQLLEYYEMYSALEILLIQGFYAAFEHLVYELEYDMINAESIRMAVEEASEIIFGTVCYDDISSVMITHTVLYPHYVEAYCTSITSSLEIFFREIEEDGAGLDIYLDLITRDSDEYRTYADELEAVGLSSPFSEGYLKEISDAIHYHILGAHYFRDESGGGNNVCGLAREAA